MGWCHTCRLIHYPNAKKAATDPYTIDWSGVTPSFNASLIRAVTSSRMRLPGEQLQFDIRQMTSSEVESFTNDCMRTVVAEIRAGTVKPH
jgi:hypothetical protein